MPKRTDIRKILIIGDDHDQSAVKKASKHQIVWNV